MLNHHAYTSIFYHLVWATKNAQPLIKSTFKPNLYRYIAKLISDKKWHALAIGGVDDHIHILLQADANCAPCKVIAYLKSNSSKFIREQFLEEFAWQKGYSLFTVDRRVLSSLKTYINRQEEHHKAKNFQEEYTLMLRRNYFKYSNRSCRAIYGDSEAAQSERVG